MRRTGRLRGHYGVHGASTGPGPACPVVLEALDPSAGPGSQAVPSFVAFVRRPPVPRCPGPRVRERWPLLKILVTGSRTWTDARKIEQEIFRALYEVKTPHCEAVLIHGACPSGADAIADHYATDAGMYVLRFAADWERYGRRAGYLRNVELVATGPDICLAFIHKGSRGASMTADLASKAGIETRRFFA
ncbi:DUF2493 domain-containing protein [Streptomyces sp. NPDC051014]|uniref:DUF2493 domain-containing protein n=1 Tax=Streptomyces sp. NPDC051014 TaxID=3155751 RepID=UPI0033E8FA03